MRTGNMRNPFWIWSMVSVLAVSMIAGPSVAGAAAQGTAASPYVIQPADVKGQSLNLRTAQEHMISPDINTASSDPVSVIVQLTDQPAAVSLHDSKLEASKGIESEQLGPAADEQMVASQQNLILQQARNQSISYTVNYRYNTVLNGMEMTLPANQIPALAKLPGVKSIYQNKTYTTMPVQDRTATQATYDPTPLSLIGAPIAWQKGLTGKGVKVGVVDTGIDSDHPDLIGAYKGGYDSVDHDNDPYETPPVSVQDDVYKKGYPGSSHGTHVSGTIAGRAANQQGEVNQKGVAYGADLYVYRVMKRDPVTNEETGDSATIIDGIEHAVKDGMDVINLSIGSDADKDVNAPDSIAVNNAVLSGVTVVIANGNAAAPGSYYYSMGEPATSQLAIAVGASSVPFSQYVATVHADVYGTADHATPVTGDVYGSSKPAKSASTVSSDVYDANVNQDYALQMLAWKTHQEDFASIIGKAPVQGIYVGLGSETDYEGKDVKDKVVIVSRGGIGFTDKAENAAKHGARAVILFNGNADPSHPGKADLSKSISGRDSYIGGAAFMGDGFTYVPTFDMKGAEGRALIRASLAQGGQPITFTFDTKYPKQDVSGDHIASFSSRGPNQDGVLGVKPDLVAPGVTIRSTVPAYGKYIKDANYADAYKRESGTSMASPHVAGMAALLKQEHPDWTPFDIRAALANTSESLVDESGQRYDVYSQGAGRADVGAAVNTPALLETVDDITILDKDFNRKTVTNYNPSAAFGVMQPDGKPHEQPLQLKNTSGSSVIYHASVSMHPSVTSDPSAPVATPDVKAIQAVLQGLDANGMITAAANSAVSFNLEVTPSTAAAEGVYEGEVDLTAEGYPALHLPFSLHIGKDQPDTGLGLQQVEVNHPAVRLDGKQDSADVTFRLLSNNVNALELDAVTLDGQYAGTLVQTIKQPTATASPAFAPGYYHLTGLDNIVTYFGDDGTGETRILQPGTYSLQLNAFNIDKNGNIKQSATKRASTAYRIAGTEKDRVATAAARFRTIQTGNQTVGQPVLALPQDNRLDYKILSSSDPQLVENSGKLLKLPASSYRIVRLQLKISSIHDPAASQTVSALIKVKGTGK